MHTAMMRVLPFFIQFASIVSIKKLRIKLVLSYRTSNYTIKRYYDSDMMTDETYADTVIIVGR